MEKSDVKGIVVLNFRCKVTERLLGKLSLKTNGQLNLTFTLTHNYDYVNGSFFSERSVTYCTVYICCDD